MLGSAGEAALLEVIMRHCNGRIYRERVPAESAGSIDVPENEIEETMGPSTSNSLDRRFTDRELVSAIETAIDELPARYRAVFMLRDVEEMNTAETAECLDIPKHSVETRLRQARALLRQKLRREPGVAVRKSFMLGVARCDHMVARVLTRIKTAGSAAAAPSRPKSSR